MVDAATNTTTAATNGSSSSSSSSSNALQHRGQRHNHSTRSTCSSSSSILLHKFLPLLLLPTRLSADSSPRGAKAPALLVGVCSLLFGIAAFAFLLSFVALRRGGTLVPLAETHERALHFDYTYGRPNATVWFRDPLPLPPMTADVGRRREERREPSSVCYTASRAHRCKSSPSHRRWLGHQRQVASRGKSSAHVRSPSCAKSALSRRPFSSTLQMTT